MWPREIRLYWGMQADFSCLMTFCDIIYIYFLCNVSVSSGWYMRGRQNASKEVLARGVNLCRWHGARKEILYGSRIKVTAWRKNDIDIAISGIADIEKLREVVENISMLYMVDLLLLDDCPNALLLENTEKYG